MLSTCVSLTWATNQWHEKVIKICSGYATLLRRSFVSAFYKAIRKAGTFNLKDITAVSGNVPYNLYAMAQVLRQIL